MVKEAPGPGESGGNHATARRLCNGAADHFVRFDEAADFPQQKAALEAEMAARKAAEDALRCREAQLTAFVETASIGLHWVNADGIIIWANAAELDLLGYAKDEYIGHHIAEFHVERSQIEEILACLSRGERLRDREARLRCKDGSVKTVLMDSSVLWEDGRFVHTQCFTRDVTEQRRAEQKLAAANATLQQQVADLRQLQERFQLAAHGRTLTLFEQDTALRYQWLYPIHPEHAGALGRTDEEILGSAGAEIAALKRVVIATGLMRQAEVCAPLPDGIRYYDITVVPKLDPSGAILGVTGAAFDITARRQAEQALRDAKEETARVNRELEQRVRERTASLTDLLAEMESFSYAVSHDLRSPLRAMAGYAAILQNDHSAQLGDEGLRMLERIIRSSERMGRLITDVLAYTRVNRDRFELTPVGLADCLWSVVQHAPELQPPQANLIVRGTLPTVLGNEAFVTQVIANILGNAVKFVAPGTTPRVEVASEVIGDRVRLSIRDNGIGITPEHRERLFGLFERLNAGGRYEGSGMGLAIARRALERMGGTITVDSDGRSGSCFVIEMALAS